MKKMLVVVDYQVDFVNGSLGFDGAEKLDAGIAAMVRDAADKGDIIVVTRDTHAADYLKTREGKALPIEHCIRGQKGWEIYGETRKALEEVSKAPEMAENLVYIDKETFGVSPADMLMLSRKFAVDEVVLVGLVTNMCVMANVCCFQACFPAAQMVVDADLCDSFDKELHKKTIDVLKGMQVKVLRDPWLHRAI